MARSSKGWTAYKVGYDNGEVRHFSSEQAAMSHAKAKAKTMTVVCVYGPDGRLIGRWSHGFRDGSVPQTY